MLIIIVDLLIFYIIIGLSYLLIIYPRNGPGLDISHEIFVILCWPLVMLFWFGIKLGKIIDMVEHVLK